jgi:NTE family protein
MATPPDLSPNEAPESARGQRRGTALCLSGGGFRAALFHLGALRRLNELGVLSRVETVSAVSGGSIIAAHLARRVPDWPKPGAPVPDWDATVAAPFRGFAGHNLRTGPLLASLLPTHWGDRDAAIRALAGRIERALTPAALPDLPERPAYIFSATTMAFGSNWRFARERIGDYRLGYLRPDAEWSVATAVAASSCFPPVFSPMRLELEPGDLKGGTYRGSDRDELVRHLGLTDGGLYDNMGLEPAWRRHRTVLVSDGGGVFDFVLTFGAVGRLLRYAAIVGKQATAIRRRWLIAGLETGRLDGAYWGIATVAASDVAATYAAGTMEAISAIRTDLDAFSTAEIAILENHGYLAADAAMRGKAPHLIARDAPLAVPHPAWLDDGKAREALRGSHKRTLLGRFRA